MMKHNLLDGVKMIELLQLFWIMCVSTRIFRVHKNKIGPATHAKVSQKSLPLVNPRFGVLIYLYIDCSHIFCQTTCMLSTS